MLIQSQNKKILCNINDFDEIYIKDNKTITRGSYSICVLPKTKHFPVVIGTYTYKNKKLSLKEMNQNAKNKALAILEDIKSNLDNKLFELPLDTK